MCCSSVTGRQEYDCGVADRVSLERRDLAFTCSSPFPLCKIINGSLLI